jgi:hypothetical protein
MRSPKIDPDLEPVYDAIAEPVEALVYPNCEHIKPGGKRCGSPALKGGTLCFYHTDVRRRVPKNNLFVFLANPRPHESPYYPFELPYMEDPEAIQMAFAQFIHAVSQQMITESRARLVLSALHGAAANLRYMAEMEAQKKKAGAAKQPEVMASVEAEAVSGDTLTGPESTP